MLEKRKAMKIGIVDVGGGFRGIYAAGVLDYCIDQQIHFDLGIGVSAGSANLASYAAGQRGRNYRFYTDYAFRKEYMSIRNLILKGYYVDMEYVFGTLSRTGGETPMDYAALQDNPMELIIVAAEAKTGKVKYFDKRDICQDDYRVMTASSAMPFACKPCEVQGILYYDGAMSDPVPVEKAFQLGCDRVIVILTKPERELRTPRRDKLIAALIRKKYPAAAAKLCQRAQRYNESVALAQEYAKQGKALIVAPDDTCGIDTLRKNKAALNQLYKKGYIDGVKISNYLYCS